MIFAACFGLTACTSTGTNFGLPKALLNGPVYADATAAVEDLTRRNEAYRDAAQGAANGSQWFDVPAILAGTAGVASVAFKDTGDLAPTAGTIAAGALGFRSYYNSSSRYGPYVGGARGASCLLTLATALESAQLTRDQIAKWRSVADTTAGSSDSDAQALNAAANAVISAPRKLSTAAVRIDTEVMRKLKAPNAPDFAAFMTNYEAASQTRRNSQQALAIVQGNKSTITSKLVAAQVTLSPALAAAIEDLDVRIEQCVAYAA